MNQQKKVPKAVHCPSCKKNINDILDLKEKGFFPFCSDKCRFSDLYGWFQEENIISRGLKEEDIESKVL